MEKLIVLLTVIHTTLAAVPKTEFYGSLLQPPVYMVGEYYSETDERGIDRLYVVPTVYIDTSSEYVPVEESYVFFYAQFAAPDVNYAERGSNTTATASGDISNAWFESWSCAM